MLLRPLLAAALVALTAGTALAEPVLRPDIAIADDIVTVGDMFADAGLFAEQAIFRAPRPGTVGHVSLAELEAAAARIGFSGYSTRGLPGVRVERLATEIGEADLVALIEADLAARGILAAGASVEARFARPVAPLRAAAVAEPARLVTLRYLPGSGGFTARFALAGIEAPLDIDGTLELMIEVPHLAAALPAGTVLRPDNVVMRPVPLRYAESTGLASLEQVLGKALTRASREGLMLKASDVAEPQVIARNDTVTIYYRSGPLTLTARGQALNAAAEGAPVQVLNLVSRRVIATRALGPGAVEVVAVPLSVAGLN